MQDVLKYCSGLLADAKVDKFQCVLASNSLHEINSEGLDLNLIRTTMDKSLRISIIKDSRKGDISINRLDSDSVSDAVLSVIELSNTSQPDQDYDISPLQEPQTFRSGPSTPDTEKMYNMLKGYLKDVSANFPKIVLSETVFSHNYSVSRFINSNGVDFTTEKGVYRMTSVFSAKDGDNVSSFNYSGFSLKEINDSLIDNGSLKNLLKQSVEHLDAKPINGKFTGDVVITPDCLDDLLSSYISTFLGDRALITGMSTFKDKLGDLVADSKFTLRSSPLSPEMADGYFVTSDGFVAKDVTLISNGVLNSFMLSLYGANKTKLKKADNSGGNWIVDAGDKSLNEIIESIDKGIVLARYSGGNPSANGDFSGIAKNSYYIEKGKIEKPVTEVMISGNLAEIMKNIMAISQERINFGFSLLPYIHSTGITISGK